MSIWGLLKIGNRADLLRKARAFASEAAADYDRGRRESEAKFLEAYRTFKKLQEKEEMARTALGLGRVYMHIHGLRDLQKSKIWYEVALANAATRLTRAQAFGSLALWEQQQLEFETADKGGVPSASLRQRLDKAEDFFCRALELMPEGSVDSRAVSLRGLAWVREKQGDIDGAERCLQEAIVAYADAGKAEKAATALLNLASVMVSAGRLQVALQYSSNAIIALDKVPASQHSTDWLNVYQGAIQQRDSIRRYLQQTNLRR